MSSCYVRVRSRFARDDGMEKLTALITLCERTPSVDYSRKWSVMWSFYFSLLLTRLSCWKSLSRPGYERPWGTCDVAVIESPKAVRYYKNLFNVLSVAHRQHFWNVASVKQQIEDWFPISPHRYNSYRAKLSKFSYSMRKIRGYRKLHHKPKFKCSHMILTFMY